MQTNCETNCDFTKCVNVKNIASFSGLDEETLDASNCVQLTKKERDEAKISVKIKKSDNAISRLILIGQCKRIEVFLGSDMKNPGAYFATFTGQIHKDSDEDFKVYTFDMEFQPGQKSLILNLKSTESNVFWILNLIIVTDFIDMKQSLDRFDLTNLNPQLELSDKAKEFKKLFENFQNSKPSSLVSFSANEDIVGSLSMIPRANSCDCDKCFRKIEETEQKIMKKLNEQDQKLDLILQMLKEK